MDAQIPFICDLTDTYIQGIEDLQTAERILTVLRMELDRVISHGFHPLEQAYSDEIVHLIMETRRRQYILMEKVIVWKPSGDYRSERY